MTLSPAGKPRPSDRTRRGPWCCGRAARCCYRFRISRTGTPGSGSSWGCRLRPPGRPGRDARAVVYRATLRRLVRASGFDILAERATGLLSPGHLRSGRPETSDREQERPGTGRYQAHSVRLPVHLEAHLARSGNSSCRSHLTRLARLVPARSRRERPRSRRNRTKRAVPAMKMRPGGNTCHHRKRGTAGVCRDDRGHRTGHAQIRYADRLEARRPFGRLARRQRRNLTVGAARARGLRYSAIAWLAALSRVPLGVAYPFNALGYLGILTASVFLLHERANVLTWAGSVMVVSGLIVVIWPGRSRPHAGCGMTPDRDLRGRPGSSDITDPASVFARVPARRRYGRRRVGSEPGGQAPLTPRLERRSGSRQAASW